MRWFRRGPRTPTWLVVGLGNPGPKYERNRHNVGFMVVDKLAERHRITVGRKRPHAFVGEGNADLGGDPVRVVLAKPRTYMNESGEAVVRLAQASGAPKERMVVVYDDLDLPLGKLRVRAKGSPGGHNGIKSIVGKLNTDAFPRIRVGIGRPTGVEGAVSHVLGDFTDEERERIGPAVELAADAVEWTIAHGVESAMNRFNAG